MSTELEAGRPGFSLGYLALQGISYSEPQLAQLHKGLETSVGVGETPGDVHLKVLPNYFSEV
jgi:hypothetical protein